MKLRSLVDDVSGNVAIYCPSCGDVLLAIETSGTPDSLLDGHEHGTARVTVNLEKVGADDLYECGDSCCNMAVCICGDCPGCSGGIE
ncbi:MAG: hypothetical protein V3W28_01640 [Thermoplasmata archaeon]